MEPSYFETGLFKKDVPHQITVIKKADGLWMQVRNKEGKQLFHWKTDGFPPIVEGRIGLRHMWTRGARYRDFQIARLRADDGN